MPKEAFLNVFPPFVVLVEWNQEYATFIAECLQTGSVVTADDADTATSMIKELLEDETEHAIKTRSIKSLFSSPSELSTWMRCAMAAQVEVQKYQFKHSLPGWAAMRGTAEIIIVRGQQKA